MASLANNDNDTYANIFAGWHDPNQEYNASVTNACFSGSTAIRLTTDLSTSKTQKDNMTTIDNGESINKINERFNLICNNIVPQLNSFIGSNNYDIALDTNATSEVTLTICIFDISMLQKSIIALEKCNYTLLLTREQEFLHEFRYNFGDKDDGGGKRTLFISIKENKKLEVV